MNGDHVKVDVSELKRFSEKLRMAADGGLRRDFLTFLEASGFELLRIIQDEVIRTKAVDTRLLLNSFHKGNENNIYSLSEGDVTLEIGTNLEYAKWVNDGHWLNPQGVSERFVPGVWNADGKFRYAPKAKTGMLLRQKFVPGKHFMEHSVKIMEKLFPKMVESWLDKWLDNLLG
jgi:hypothetical protein